LKSALAYLCSSFALTYRDAKLTTNIWLTLICKTAGGDPQSNK
jgi:hypothetical protein